MTERNNLFMISHLSLWIHVPIWPMKAVSIKEAMGSAVNASAAGKAIVAISTPSSSFLKTSLKKINYNSLLASQQKKIIESLVN